jgi:hypothetical protein
VVLLIVKHPGRWVVISRGIYLELPVHAHSLGALTIDAEAGDPLEFDPAEPPRNRGQQDDSGRENLELLRSGEQCAQSVWLRFQSK